MHTLESHCEKLHGICDMPSTVLQQMLPSSLSLVNLGKVLDFRWSLYQLGGFEDI